MKIVPFMKYTNCGNNFVVLDETSAIYLLEREKHLFARKARNVFFGIGSDGLLVIQTPKLDILKKINDDFRYWTKLPSSESCDYVFRLFETLGKEALSCGNGLLCIARYLYEHHGIEKANIMTEVPLSKPRIVTIGVDKRKDISWCNIGQPRLAPNDVLSLDKVDHSNGRFGFIEKIKINFRSHDLHPFSDLTTILLSGYLIYTGEPHLVVFPNEFLSPELVVTMFLSDDVNSNEKRGNFGSWLLSHIGASINKYYHDIFPSGVNVCFVSVDSRTEIIQYRCYERGINRETLACGTGALAISYIVKELQLLTGKSFKLQPHRCNWYHPETYQQVDLVKGDWVLKGSPLQLFTGEMKFQSALVRTLDDKKSIPWGMLHEVKSTNLNK